MSIAKKLILLVVLVAVGWFIANATPASRPVVSNELGAYFQSETFERAVENMGGAMPIEGFDPELLMGALPGLARTDFEGVRAFEGTYRVGPADELEFVRDQAMPVSSAERTVSEEGYETLLVNVSRRLNMTVVDEASVDAIIDAIDIGVQDKPLGSGDGIETFEARIGQRVGSSEFITPIELVSDSRCPQDVQCIQAGTVRVEATIESGMGTATEIFTLGTPITTEVNEITLLEVSPARFEGEQPAPGDYIFTFGIVRRTM